MPKVIGVRFRTSPRVYYFAPTEGVEYAKDMRIVVETQRGVELATVVMPVTEVTEDRIVAPLKPVLRIATDEDIEAVTADSDKKQEIISIAKQKVEARGLDMKIVDCEFTVDHSKLVLYFTAEQRVDFRDLVRDLASAFHNRIDLRQIGARDECKLIGSLGSCGMPCCCGRFESDSEHVSIKMAKNQNLALTPNKINGMCGRLLCCLAYENKTYEDVLKRCPKHNAVVTLSDGRQGSVVSVTPLTEKVRVKIGGDDNFEFVDVDLAEITGESKKPDSQKPAEKNHEKAEEKNAAKTEKAVVDTSDFPEPPPERHNKNNRRRNKNKGNNNHNNNSNGQANNQNNNNNGSNNNQNNNAKKRNNRNRHRNKNNAGGQSGEQKQ